MNLSDIEVGVELYYLHAADSVVDKVTVVKKNWYRVYIFFHSNDSVDVGTCMWCSPSVLHKVKPRIEA